MATLSDSQLHTLIRWKLERGALPLQEQNQRVYDGYGGNRECDGCGQRISTSDVLFEVEAGNSSLMALDRQCFDVWLIESRASAPAESSRGAVVSDRGLPHLR
jgi:hypothetical protein